MRKKHKPIPELTDQQFRNFWSKVRKTRKHWLWTGSKDKKGYGFVNLNDTPYFVSRVAYSLYTGNDPGDLCVLHRCDTPSCCNPKHLFLGTIADNNKDMQDKMRHQYGERHAMTHLTEKDVIAIRRSNKTMRVLGKQYGVTRHAIGLIQLGKRWKHAGGPIRTSRSRKLSEKDVIEIRKATDTLVTIAEKYGVDITTISKIQLGHLHPKIAPELIRKRDYKRYPAKTLTKAQVQEIKTALKNPYWGLSKKLAKQYGVKPTTISAIKTGRLWGSV